MGKYPCERVLAEHMLETKVNGMTLSTQRSTNKNVFFTPQQMENETFECDSRVPLWQDSLISLTGEPSSVSNQCLQMEQEVDTLEDFANVIQMTQQTLEMAQACLNNSLFADLSAERNQKIGSHAFPGPGPSHLSSAFFAHDGNCHHGLILDNGLVNQRYDNFQEGQVHTKNFVDAMGLPFFMYDVNMNNLRCQNACRPLIKEDFVTFS
jgi:hypothetical protein